MKDIKKYLKYIGNVLALLSIIFVIYAISQMEIDTASIHNWNRIIIIGILGCAICIISTGLLALAWQRILENLAGKKIEYWTAYKIYVKANLGKYIPGNVMHYVERNIFAGQMGLGQTEVALTSALEIVGLIVAAAILSIILSFEKLLVILEELITVKYIVMILIAILLVMITLCICLKRVLKLKMLVSKMKKISFWKMFLVNILIYMLALLLLGMIMVMLVWSMGQVHCQISDVKVIITAYIVAWLLGFVVPGAPGGIGVREFVISVITEGTSIGAIVLLAAVVHRVITVAGDVASYILGKIVGGRNK